MRERSAGVPTIHKLTATLTRYLVDPDGDLPPLADDAPPSGKLIVAVASIGAVNLQAGGATFMEATTKLVQLARKRLGDGIPVDLGPETDDVNIIFAPADQRPPTHRFVAMIDDDGEGDTVSVGASVETPEINAAAIGATVAEALQRLRLKIAELLDDGLPVIVKAKIPAPAAPVPEAPETDDAWVLDDEAAYAALAVSADVAVVLGDEPIETEAEAEARRINDEATANARAVRLAAIAASLVEAEAATPGEAFEPVPAEGIDRLMAQHFTLRPDERVNVPADAKRPAPEDPLVNLPSGKRQGAARVTPALSVVMLTTPARAKLARMSWESILRQEDAEPFEVIIVCDLAPDDVEYAHHDATYATRDGVPFDVHRIHSTFTNVTDKLNAGFDNARAPWVMLWDDDDWSSSDRIAETQATIRMLDEDADGDINSIGFLSPPAMYRYELAADTHRLFTYTSPTLAPEPGSRPIPACMTVRRPLWEKYPFFTVKSTKPTQNELGYWTMKRIADGWTPMTVDFAVVGMAHGNNMSVPTRFRVESVAPYRVWDGNEYALAAEDGRKAVAGLIGATTLHDFEHALRR